jgi:ubiquitin-conjugating enzyme E2 O
MLLFSRAILLFNIIRKPLKNFDEFVKEHFRQRGHVLLAACKEYANGRVRVGYYGYNSNNEIASRSSTVMIKVSDSFQASLKNAYRNLYKQFLECGAELESFVEELEVETGKKKSNGGNGSILKKAMGKIKQALGLKKKKST